MEMEKNDICHNVQTIVQPKTPVQPTVGVFWNKNYLEQVLGRTPNWQDREIWFSLSNDTLKYKAQPQDVLVFPFLSSV